MLSLENTIHILKKRIKFIKKRHILINESIHFRLDNKNKSC